MSRGSERIRVQHMIDAASRAASMAAGRRRADLDENEMLFLALTRLVEIVGEAAKSVGVETRERHPRVPWRAMAGARDRLIHGYFDVDRDVLWRMVSIDLPGVLPLLTAVMNDPELQ